MTIGHNPIAQIRAGLMLADIRRIGCPAPAIVDAIVIGGVDVGNPAPVDIRTDGVLPDAIDRGFAVRHNDGSWEPTALGVLSSWAFYHGYFSGP